jgi:hypothetical protein
MDIFMIIYVHGIFQKPDSSPRTNDDPNSPSPANSYRKTCGLTLPRGTIYPQMLAIEIRFKGSSARSRVTTKVAITSYQNYYHSTNQLLPVCILVTHQKDPKAIPKVPKVQITTVFDDFTQILPGISPAQVGGQPLVLGRGLSFMKIDPETGPGNHGNRCRSKSRVTLV